MMVTTIGQIQEFHPDNESFSSYVERVQLIFTANDIADDKKVAELLPRTLNDLTTSTPLNT